MNKKLSDLDLQGYNARDLHVAERAFRRSPEAYHPLTRFWITADFGVHARRPTHKSRDVEYGLCRLNNVDLKHQYMKYMKANGLSPKDPKDLHAKVQAMLHKALAQWKSEPRKPRLEVRVGTRDRVLEIISDVSRRMKVPPSRVGWIEHSDNPIRMAVYSSSTRTLLLHDFVTQMRYADIVILSLHEILGHAYQESKTRFPVSVLEAEHCASLCENVSEVLFGTRRYALEWKIFRLARAMVDLRLHCMPHGKSAMDIWKSVNHKVGGALHHFVPFFDETLRCAALPAQALTYVLDRNKNKKKEKNSPRGCHPSCTVFAPRSASFGK
jgi:hypothetical protein